MPGVEVIWTGMEQLIARLETAAVAAPAGVAVTMYKVANDILAKALPITPIETGNLRSTGHVELPRVGGGQVEVAIGFGGAAAPYAVFVHENLEAYHEPPTQAKFLEQPVLESREQLARDLGLALKATFG